MNRIAIIGGGASGLVAAISAAKTCRAEIVLFERNERVGKKLLQTGNGRCNLSNSEISGADFQNDGGGFVTAVIENCGVEKTLGFFAECGLYCKKTRGGRIYPYHEQASAVLDIFRNELAHRKVNLITDAQVTDIKAVNAGFRVVYKTSGGIKTKEFDRVIVSTGGKAAPKTGSDGGGFSLLGALGHVPSVITPALAQLKTDNDFTNSLKGIKINAALTAAEGENILKKALGEIIFTAYGLSGTAAFEVSGHALAAAGHVTLRIDFFPDTDRADIIEMLNNRVINLGHLPAGEFFTGFINKRIGQALLKLACPDKQNVREITSRDIINLADKLKGFELNLKGHTGWDFAQTSYGGVSGAEFDPSTLESKIVKGLFATGELFGFAGGCGGFNLQWAWSTGIIAGAAAVQGL